MASNRSLLLYRDSQFFIVIPLRTLSEGAVEEITNALKQVGVRQKGQWK
jgi:hypothetical protein